MKLNYRMHRAADKAELVNLWTNQAEWDQIDEQTWEHRFGKAAIVVAVDQATDKIVGQIVFIPVEVWIQGAKLSAYRPFATFLIKEARNFQSLNPLSHPMYQMYQLGIQTFRAQGAKLILMLPDPMWGRMIQFFPNFEVARFPLYSLGIAETETLSLNENYTTVEIDPSDPRIDELWEKAARLYERSTVRNSATLSWKTSHHRHHFVGIEKEGQLVGFAAARFKANDRQWLICDVLASDAESLRSIIIASCLQARSFKNNDPSASLDKIAILASEILLPVVTELGFYKDNYNFIFALQILDNTLSREEIAPSKWYLSANN